jgi:hypothetical protein
LKTNHLAALKGRHAMQVQKKMRKQVLQRPAVFFSRWFFSRLRQVGKSGQVFGSATFRSSARAMSLRIQQCNKVVAAAMVVLLFLVVDFNFVSWSSDVLTARGGSRLIFWSRVRLRLHILSTGFFVH